MALGRARTSSAATATEVAPAAHPTSVNGSRRTSRRNPNASTRYASNAGINTPVHDVSITTSTSDAATPAASNAPRAAASPNAQLAARYLDLRKGLEARLARNEPVPVRVQRLSSDAATALLQGDDAAARLYLDEMERLLGE